MGRDGKSTSLAPGFRFHPTDEELVSYYLKRKISGKPFRFDAITEIDIYKAEPWDLPGFSKLKTRDLEWYFFSALDKKYGNGSRTNRATNEGYWKTTGKDRPVHHRCRIVGMKKTLVYHRGRAPRGQRSNWVMHEYRLLDEGVQNAELAPESFVLCRIFQKSGTGPKNGEQYGAPFVEEEWEDDNKEVAMPGDLVVDDMIDMDDSLFGLNDLDQNLELELPMENCVPPANFPIEIGGSYVGDGTAFTETDLKSLTEIGQAPFGLGLNGNQGPSLPLQPETGIPENEYTAGAIAAVSHAPTSTLPLCEQGEENLKGVADEGLFLEANDLSEPIEANNSLDYGQLDEYLTYFDAEDNIDQYLNFDTSDFLLNDAPFSDGDLFTQEDLGLLGKQGSKQGQLLSEVQSFDSASSSKQQGMAPSKSKPDFDYPFLKQASHMLGNFPAPPALAAEFPTKEMAARLNAATAQTPEPVNVTAGMVRIRNPEEALNSNEMRWSLDKNGNVNFVLSFNLSESVVSESISGILSGKTVAPTFSRCWFYFFFWLMAILAISVKISTCIYAK